MFLGGWVCGCFGLGFGVKFCCFGFVGGSVVVQLMVVCGFGLVLGLVLGLWWCDVLVC